MKLHASLLLILVGCSSFGGTEVNGSAPSSTDTDGGQNGGPVAGVPADDSVLFASFDSPNFVIHGETAKVLVRLKRGRDFKDPVNVVVQNLRSSVTAKSITIAGDSDSAELELTAADGAAQGDAGGVLSTTVNGATITTDLKAFVRGKHGEVDVTYGPGGSGTLVPTASRFVQLADVVLAPDDSLYVISTNGVVRFKPDATLDTTYGNSGFFTTDSWSASAGKLLLDGRLLLVGGANVPQPGTDDTTGGAAGAVLPNGTADPSFDYHTTLPYLGTSGLTGFNQLATSIGVRSSDGDIFIGWRNLDPQGHPRTAVSHLKSNGTFVSGFGASGAARPTSPTLGATANSGEPVVIVRNGPQGNGNVALVWVQEEYAGGTATDSVGFSQLNGDSGAFDPSVGGPKVAPFSGSELLGTAAELADGSIICSITRGSSFLLYKILPNGDAAPGFGSGSTPGIAGPFDTSAGSAFSSGSPNTIVPQSDGTFLVAMTSASGNTRLARFTANGQLDQSFATGGIAQASFPNINGNAYGSRAVVQKGGRILLVASSQTGSGPAIQYTAFWP